MAAFRYHKNVQSRQYVNDVFMICNIGKGRGEVPIVIKVKTPAIINKRSRLSRAKQGVLIWGAGYGFRITKLKK